MGKTPKKNNQPSKPKAPRTERPGKKATTKPQGFAAEKYTSMPAAIAGCEMNSDARIISRGRGTRITHSEMVSTGAFSSTGTGFNVCLALSVNPGAAPTFPWGSTIADNFEEYTVVRISYRFVSRLPTNTAGSVFLGFDPNAGDISPASSQLFMNWKRATTGSVFQPLTMELDTKDLHPMGPRKYIRNSGVPSTADDRVFDVGTVSVAVEGVASGVVGYLYADYEVDLFNPSPVLATSLSFVGGTSGGGGLPTVIISPTNLWGWIEQTFLPGPAGTIQANQTGRNLVCQAISNNLIVEGLRPGTVYQMCAAFYDFTAGGGGVVGFTGAVQVASTIGISILNSLSTYQHAAGVATCIVLLDFIQSVATPDGVGVFVWDASALTASLAGSISLLFTELPALPTFAGVTLAGHQLGDGPTPHGKMLLESSASSARALMEMEYRGTPELHDKLRAMRVRPLQRRPHP